MATYFADRGAGAGTYFAGEALPSNGPTVNSQPTARSWVYNVANTYDVGAGVSGALSYEISPAVAGFTINDAGLLSFSGSAVDPAVEPLSIIAYDQASQGGNPTSLNTFNVFLDLGTPATINYGPRLGFLTAPGGTLKQDLGVDGNGSGLDTCEVTTIPAGCTASMLAGGVMAGSTPEVNGAYVFGVRYWDRSAIQTGTNTINVVLPAAPVFSGTIPTQTLQVGVPINALNLNNYFNPDPDTYASLGDALPAGLSILNGLISGTPTSVGSGSLQYRGSNAEGNDDTNVFTYSVAAASQAPVFSGTIPTQTWQVGIAVSLDLNVYFNPNPTSFASLGDALPPGLSISNGIIGGIPSSETTGSLQYRGTNASGFDDTNTFSFGIVAQTAPPVFSGTIPNKNWQVGVAITPVILSSYYNPDPVSYSALGDGLPSGLSISSGTISGTPTVEASGSLQYRGTSPDGTDDTNVFTFNIAAASSDPPVFIGTIPNQSWQVGVQITPLDLNSFFNPNPASYGSIGDLLPVGLEISFGSIIGTPSQESTGSLQFRGTNGGGSDDTNSFAYTVAAAALSPPIFTGTIPAQNWQVGVPINSLNLGAYYTNTPTSYSSIGDALPTGLSLVGSVITGTPTAVSNGDLQYNAVNADGNDNTNTFAYNVVSASTYPSLFQEEPLIVPINSREVSITDGGGARFIDQAESETFQITFKHLALSESEWQQLLTFYTNNKDNTITFNAILEGGTYSSSFKNRPIPKHRSAARIDVAVTLIGTRQ